MKNIAMVAATAVAFIAVPAKADETRLEARGGVVWFDGGEEAVAGVAAGHDFHLDESFFIGIEGSADKVLADGADVLFGATARAGFIVAEDLKLFVAAGYSFNNSDAVHAGGGLQYNVSDQVYLKTEYRIYFDGFANINSAVAGVGFRF
ncbi:outer membrane protein [Altererythrobacter ishigakiensis]|jgi:opacity protein-like surface antigen|uniref:Outer membrane protein beta-barrel domain-containing protein n=1 Tax=Altererythrobacter ishigakiensis TaxID=476157 RepID=A0A562UXD7_9SPHN|nr:hypothetical protein [Altererythrobacter ishigakiensis]MDX1703669.1 hypothetical protein [Altererythrobacter ishigakiensis]TWJ10289.1 hypothetical protein JN10_1951 [Altererythrobacter ishigakiensis]